jgi:putative spermidine/putrescine transport system permease protein
MMVLTGWARSVVFGLAWLVGSFLLLPGLVTIPVSLNDSRFIALPSGSISLRHFQTLFTDGKWLSNIAQSLTIGITAMLIAVTLGTLCSIGLWRVSRKLAAIVGAMVLAPMILPPIVAALALYRAWVSLSLYDSWLGVVIAHTILALPYVIITVTASLSLVDHRLEQAARSLGAAPLRTMIDVVLPNIRAGVLTGAVFAFIVSWDETVVTLFISSRAVYTLPRRIWDGIRENVDPTVTAVATLLIILTAIGVATAIVISMRRPRRESQPTA